MADKVYIFYSLKENEISTVYVKEVRYSSIDEFVSSIASVMKDIFSSGNVEYLVVQQTPIFPDTKATFMQNEMVNIAKRASQAIQQLNAKVDALIEENTKLKKDNVELIDEQGRIHSTLDAMVSE